MMLEARKIELKRDNFMPFYELVSFYFRVQHSVDFFSPSETHNNNPLEKHSNANQFWIKIKYLDFLLFVVVVVRQL